MPIAQDEFIMIVFSAFNTWHMVALCFTMVGIYLYKAKLPGVKHRAKRVRAIMYAILGLAFVAITVFEYSNDFQRALLRFTFGFLVLSEVGYNLDIVYRIVGDIWTWVSSHNGSVSDSS